MSDVPLFSLPEEVNLGEVYRGDTVVLPVWTAMDRYGAVMDLAGASIWFTAKTSPDLDDDEPPAFQQSTATDGIEIISAPAGTYRVTIGAAKTAALTASTAFFWDVQVRTAAGVTETVKRGVLLVSEDITRTVA